jgi:serine/threonine protein phosphatase PrpC
VILVDFSKLEILEYSINEKSKFLILASDGLWEFLTTDRVSDIVYWYYNMNSVDGATDRLIEEATKLWITVIFINEAR